MPSNEINKYKSCTLEELRIEVMRDLSKCKDDNDIVKLLCSYIIWARDMMIALGLDAAPHLIHSLSCIVGIMAEYKVQQIQLKRLGIEDVTPPA